MSWFNFIFWFKFLKSRSILWETELSSSASHTVLLSVIETSKKFSKRNKKCKFVLNGKMKLAES